MRQLTLALVLVLAACARDPQPAGRDAGSADAAPVRLCGEVACAAGEACLERAGAPGVPACVAPDDCEARAAGSDAFGDALGAVGFDRCTVAIPEDYFPGAPAEMLDDDFRLPHFDSLHRRPLLVPGWGARLADAFARPAGALATSTAIANAAERLGYPLSRARYGHAVDPSNPLARAVSDLVSARGGVPDESALGADASDVPAALQSKLALVVYALGEAANARDIAFAGAPDLALLYRCATALVLPASDCGSFSPADGTVGPLLRDGIQWSLLYQGAHDLAAAIEDADFAAHAGSEGIAFDQRTPLGRIVVADAAAHEYEDGEPIALLLELGGADTYRTSVGATASPLTPVAVLIDVAGDDTYGYREVAAAGDAGRLPSDGAGRLAERNVATGETARTKSDTPRQGSGRTGIGFAFDLGGNDRYRSLRMSQGFGALGVGVLADRSGDDAYEAEAAAQGSAIFGIGLLLDGEGDDSRRLYAYGQGFGFSRGIGVLADGEGNDEYFANPGDPAEGGDPLYFNPQLPGRANTSLAQGAAFGRRDDTGKTAMSGGVGLLADFGAGNDAYTASVFAQGTGYWFGTGVLHDEGGDDAYDGKWYVRGSSAHFAIALFRDRAGNDAHDQKLADANTSFGVGHDFSIGWLIDDAGDDRWSAPNLSLGAGNACGWGFFVDGAGDDAYRSRGVTMGRFGDAKRCRPDDGNTVGVMLDLGGTDTYEIGGQRVERSDTTTLAPPLEDAPHARGAHVDAAEGALLILP